MKAIPEKGKDATPSLLDQAKANNWEAGIFDFGLAEGENIAHFNPSIVERPDGLWLIVRRAVFEQADNLGLNSCWAFKLDQNLKPEMGKRLKFPSVDPIEQFEDPRATFFNNNTWVGAVNFIWYGDGNWTGARQVLGVFDEEWECKKMFRPEIGGNSTDVEVKADKMQKNWLWFPHEGKLSLLYHSNPWRIAGFGNGLEEVTPYESPGISCNYGEIRGGTPPVLVDDLYWTFFHSSMPWIAPFRRYYMGAVGFESKPPFKPVMMTPSPLLSGSQNDHWAPKKPLVVFPGGSLFKDNEWLVVYGINDLKCGWVRIPQTDLLKLAEPIHDLSAVPVLDEPERQTRPDAEALAKVRMNVGDSDGEAREGTKPVGRSDTEVADNSRGGTQQLNGHEPIEPDAFEVAMHAPCPNQGFASLGDEIRFHVDKLVELENGKFSRHQRILTELRQKKLVPRARKRA